VGLSPFFRFYGGKWRDTPRFYPAPVYGTIVEPFAGSAGYAVRYAERNVVLCEIDPIIAAVWDFLIHVSYGEIMDIPDLGPGESVDDLPVCQEARWLVGFWLNPGASSPRKSPSKWMRGGTRPRCSFWGWAVRERVAAQVGSIRHWRVFNCSYEDCPVTEPATWFVDPPYEGAGKHYRFGPSGIDYDALGKWCKELPGQVIVCENEGATWLPFEYLGDVRAARLGYRSVEVSWVS
jgi:hypothetical protein